MKISDNEAHSATYRSENEHFARRCRHYKSKDCKAEFISQGIDCSQFITYMLQMADIDLTDLAFIQYYEFRNNLDYEIYYDIESLQPGDLIFYYSMDCEYGDNCEFWNEIHHVAMYMGDGKLIEATGNPGYTLIVSYTVNHEYWLMVYRVRQNAG